MEATSSRGVLSDPLTLALLALTFVTGIVDAVAFLGLGQVFAAMQTGNVIFLGFGIAGSAGAPVTAPLVGLGAFLCGGALAALAAARRPGGEGLGLREAVVVEAGLLGLAALLALVADPSPREFSAYVLIALLSLAMGLRNTVVRGISSPNLATTVLNLTLVGLAGPGLGAFAPGEELAQRGAAFAAILAGAVAGALLLKSGLALPILVALAISLAAGRMAPWRRTSR